MQSVSMSFHFYFTFIIESETQKLFQDLVHYKYQ